MTSASKNIIIVTHHYPPHITGVGSVAKNHAERLAKLGHSVTVVTSDTAPDEKNDYINNVNVIRIKANNISESWGAPFPIFSLKLIPSLLQSIKTTDIVHIHDAFYMSSFWAAVIAWWYRKPIVLTQHVSMIAHPSKIIVLIQKVVYATTGAIIFRLSDRIITFNNRIEDFLIGKKVAPLKMVTLYNGVDTDVFYPVTTEDKGKIKKEFGVSLDKKIVLFVGRFVPKKGFDKVLALRSKNYQIVCAGGEAPKEDFGDDIVFLGQLNQQKMVQAYQMADIFILPSESEGFPLSVQEAMASGIPVITTDDPGYARYNFDKKYLSLIDSTNQQLIQHTVDTLSNDSELLKKMSAYSKEYAFEHFDWKQTISKLDAIYTSLLEKNTIPHLTVVSPYFYPKIGGLENIAYNVARKLHANGEYKVSVITSNHESATYVKDIVNGMVVHRLPIEITLSNTPVNFFWYWQIKKIFRTEQPQLIHVHSPVPFIADVAALAAGNIPVVLTYHSGSMVKNKWPVDFFILLYERIFLRILFRKVKAIVAYSPEFIERELSAFAYKTTVIPPGVYSGEFPVSPLDTDKKIVTFVGRIGHHTRWKGTPELLKAIQLLSPKYPDLELRLVGDGDAIDYYRQMSINLGISSCVTFCGAKRGVDLAEEYKRTNVFVLPSTSNAESFGIVLLEAMASGRPVIGSNIGGIPQLIESGVNGLLVPPGDSKALADAIEKILTNPQLAEKFAAQSLEKSKNFTWEVQIEKYRNLFRKTLSPSKKIAIVSDAVYPFNKGGKEKRIYDISTRLANQGFDVTIYCMKWWEGKKTIMRDGVTYHAISPYYPLYIGDRRSISQGIFFSLHCFKLINKNFDMVEVDHIPHLVVFAMKVVCVLKGKKLVVTWHEVWGKKYWKEYLGGFKGLIAYWIERISIMLPDTIISVSDHTTLALQNMIRDTKNIVTIPNGLDITTIAKNTPATTGADIVFAGRLLTHKNIDVLLQAVPFLIQKKPDLSVLIIGEGPERNKLEKISKELNIQKNVSFQNFFEEHNDLYSALKASRVFVLPSTREGFGIVVLEANACGLPVVTTDHPGNGARELIVQSKNGMLSTLEPQSLALAIEQSFHIKNNSNDYSEYIEKYDWNSLISKIVDIHKK